MITPQQNYKERNANNIFSLIIFVNSLEPCQTITKIRFYNKDARKNVPIVNILTEDLSKHYTIQE